MDISSLFGDLKGLVGGEDQQSDMSLTDLLKLLAQQGMSGSLPGQASSMFGGEKLMGLPGKMLAGKAMSLLD